LVTGAAGISVRVERLRKNATIAKNSKHATPPALATFAAVYSPSIVSPLYDCGQRDGESGGFHSGEKAGRRRGEMFGQRKRYRSPATSPRQSLGHGAHKAL
jgi:hypothetical protein